tara:strand:- start:5 stop:595 length:591 start_codon:yes stop_codon:yes gene_type:complete
MKKLNICVDIDGTITEPYYWLKTANEWFHKTVCPKDVTQYDIHRVLNIERSEYLDFYKMVGEDLHRNALPRVHASRVLHELSKHHNIYYVTAREEIMKEVTVEWFERHNMPAGTLYLLGSHHKVKQAQLLKCDVFIEDKYENAIELAMARVKVLLMDCTYNNFATRLDIERVFDWLDIERKINLLASEHSTNIKIA